MKMSRNFSVHVQSDDGAHLDAAIRLCFAHSVFSHTRATHYLSENGKIALFWHGDSKATPLPYEMGVDEVISFLKGWLRKRPHAAWPTEPDTDGSTGRGWVLSNQVGSFYGVVQLTLAWVVYGK